MACAPNENPMTKVVVQLHECEICGQQGLSEDQLWHHVKALHVDGASQCPFCDASFNGKESEEITSHVSSTHLGYLTPDTEELAFLEDSAISKDFDSIWQLEMEAKAGLAHGIGQDSPVESSAAATTGSVESPMSTCTEISDCSSGSRIGYLSPFKKGAVQKKSGLTLNLKTYDCPLCDYRHPDASRLQQHVNQTHFNDEPVPGTSKESIFICPICNSKAHSGQDLEQHVNSEHQEVLKTPESVQSESCPVCSMSGFNNQNQLALHIEQHFSSPIRDTKCSLTPTSQKLLKDQLNDDFLLAQALDRKEREKRKFQELQEFAQLRAQFGMDNDGNYTEQSIQNMQKAVYKGELSVVDYYERQIDLKRSEQNGVDDGHSVTRNPIPKLKSLCSAAEVYVCTTVDHHASSFGDKGWGCGYRNLQMLLSSIKHEPSFLGKLTSDSNRNSSVLGSDGSIPSISRLQHLIEEAWNRGYDVQGRDQLGGRLVSTRKWIGATEIVAFLTSIQIRVQLVDFHCPTSKEGGHPRLFQWVLNYFRERQQSRQFTPPLYFQHQGHSRTIVGIEVVSPNSLRLLVLDPSHSRSQMACLYKNESSASTVKMLRKTQSAIKSKQYQIVAITGVYSSCQEAEAHKVIHSLPIP